MVRLGGDITSYLVVGLLLKKKKYDNKTIFIGKVLKISLKYNIYVIFVRTLSKNIHL